MFVSVSISGANKNTPMEMEVCVFAF